MVETSGVMLTVDTVLTDGFRIVLVRRGKPPFMDTWVLPGGHVEVGDQSVVSAGRRETRQEVGLDIPEECFVFVTILDRPDRDPREGRRVSVVYVARLIPEELDLVCAGDDAREAGVFPVTPELRSQMEGFDHWQAVALVFPALAGATR